MFWIVILIFVVLLLTLRFYIYSNDDYWLKKKVPFVLGAEIGPIIDRLLFRIPFHELDNRVYLRLKTFGNIKYGGLFEFRRPVAVIMDLDLIKNVMVKDFDHFLNRRQFGVRKGDPSLFNKMLVSMQAPEWKDTRAAISPTFSTGKIRRMFAIFNASSLKMVEFLKQEIGTGKDVNLRDPASRYTMDVIASAAFGVESNNFKDENSTFRIMGTRFQNQFKGLGAIKMFTSLLLPGLFKKLGLNLMDTIAVNFYSDVIKKTIEYRQRTGERREDFLQLLLDARSGQLTDDDVTVEEKNQIKSLKASAVEWTDEMILANSLLFFVAGFDTTETFIIFTLYELALNPDIQERLAQELQHAAKAQGDNGSLNYDIVNHNEYLDMVASEILRKYPPAVRTERQCTREYKIEGTGDVFPKEQVCIIPIWGIHHDPEFYPEPEKFIPERFSTENKKDRNPYTYMPFGTGPRNCIAMRFAIIKCKAAIANLVQHFKVEPCSKTTIPMVYDFGGTLKPKHGMWLKLSPRD